jgi:hypothetical protein
MTAWGHVATRAALVGAVAWVAASIADVVLLGGTSLAAPTGAPPWTVALLSLIAMELIVASLVYPAVRSSRRGPALANALFLSILGIHVVLVWVEALAVNLLPRDTIVRAFARDLLVAAIVAFLLARAVGGRRSESLAIPEHGGEAPPWTAWRWTWRVAFCAFCYLVLYITAGSLIWPAIQPFYESQHLTVNPAVVLPLQILRGAAYVLFTLPLLRSLDVTRWQAAMATAVMFPLLAGVAALIVPNPIFPDWVRAYHLGEIAWSNVVYGAIVGAMFWNRAPR